MTRMLAAISLVLVLAACGSPSSSPATVTVTRPPAAVQATAPPAAAPVITAAPAGITIPDVAGQNAEIVRKNLEDLGLTDVNLSSANPKYSMVLLASNWTVVSIEPAPGTVVQADDPVVVKVTKE